MKIVVYTANIGGFDKVYPPLLSNPDVDFVYFSDDYRILARAADAGWMTRYVAKLTNDNRKESRRIHINSYDLFAKEYDVAIQHDANTQLVACPFDLIENHLGGVDGKWEIALFKHPHRSNIYQERDACASIGKDKLINMQPQISRYEKEGFPIHTFGLSACMFIIWRHCETVCEFQHAWWKEVKGGSCREQLSFDYVRWKIKNIHVNYIPGDPFTSSIMRYNQHG